MMWEHENDNFNSSYFSGCDGTHGWGNTTFFSFFSQFNRSSPSYGIIESAMFILLFVLSIPGNIVVFSQLICDKRMRTVTNTFICNLTIADMFLTLGCPMIAVTRVTGSWIFGSWACSMMIYTDFVCGFVGIWTMVLVSLDRYFCIVSRSVTRLTQRSAVCILVLVWGFALLCFLPMALYFDIKVVTFGRSNVTICTLIWPNDPKIRISIIFTTMLILFGFIIPFTLLTWSYINIFRKFWNIRQAILKPQTQANTSQYAKPLDFKKRRDKRDLRIVKTLFSLLVLFLVMWAPVFVVFLLIVADHEMTISSQVFVYAIAVCMGNAVVNPLYYGVKVERLTARLKSCSKCYKIQSNDSVTDADAHVVEDGRVQAISNGVISEPGAGLMSVA